MVTTLKIYLNYDTILHANNKSFKSNNSKQNMVNIGILSSYNGSGYKAIDKACKDGILNAKVTVVISNNSDAKVLQSALKRDTPNYAINNSLFPNENIDKKITEILTKYNCDFIFLSGYMKKLESNILTKFKDKIINSHPALLPNFGGKGMYGKNVHEAVIKSNADKSGVTIHYVNENYDEGKHILQKVLKLNENYTADRLEKDIKKIESIAIIEAFKTIIP